MIIRLSHPLALIRTILSKLFCILIHILISLLHKVEVDVKQVPQRKKMFGIKILQFERLNDSLGPKPRSGHRMTCDNDGNLYILGGYNPDLINDYDLRHDEDWIRTRPLFAELWKYNMSSNRFIKLKTTGEFPRQLASHCVEILDNEVLISFGGTAVPFEEFPSNDLHLCNLKTKEWSLLNPVCKPESEFPTKKYGQALCMDEKDSKIYVSGGTDGFNFCMDVHCFDFKNKLWTQLTSPNDKTVEPRYRHEMTLYENRLYIFGGNNTGNDMTLETLPVFDLETRSWIECLTTGHITNDSVKFPSPRRCHITCRYKDFIFLLGGLSKKSICRDLWKFDLKTKKWTLLIEQMPIPVYFHGAACSSIGQLTFFGGITTQPIGGGQTRSKRLFSVWIDIPPLAEMAWRSLLHNKNNFKDERDFELAIMGLPGMYMKKLKDL